MLTNDIILKHEIALFNSYVKKVTQKVILVTGLALCILVGNVLVPATDSGGE